jgi:hypothetical protein
MRDSEPIDLIEQMLGVDPDAGSTMVNPFRSKDTLEAVISMPSVPEGTFKSPDKR